MYCIFFISGTTRIIPRAVIVSYILKFWQTNLYDFANKNYEIYVGIVLYTLNRESIVISEQLSKFY